MHLVYEGYMIEKALSERTSLPLYALAKPSYASSKTRMTCVDPSLLFMGVPSSRVHETRAIPSRAVSIIGPALSKELRVYRDLALGRRGSNRQGA